MKSKLYLVVILFLFCLNICIFAFEKPTVNENIIRLHILANSDSSEDQTVKLLVRDAMLTSFFPDTKIINKKVSESYFKENLRKAEQIADRVLKENGFDYTAHAQYGIYDFPVRTYGDITLPAGKYYGLRILLGEGKGQNWWCVMYPPLCLNDFNTDTENTQCETVTFDVKFKFLPFLNHMLSAK